MKIVDTRETYICDICKKELTTLQYKNCAKMTVTIHIPSKQGNSPQYTGVDKIDVCEDCVTGFGFIYDDPYIGSYERILNTLRNTYSNIISKTKLSFKFNKTK